MRYECGCINEVDEPSGILHCFQKCNFHIQWSKDHPQGETLDYFKDIGCIDKDGIPQNKTLRDELVEALSIGDIAYLQQGLEKTLLELGPGLGPYIPFFIASRWLYLSVERGEFARNWLSNTFYAPLCGSSVEEYLSDNEFPKHCIFAAHLFEHLQDAPTVLAQCYNLVTERLYLIVPDDGDPTNPDHWWFFTQESLHRLLEKIGFKNVRSQIRKRVPQENFIYCVAEK